MHKSLDPIWMRALCWRARKFASGNLGLGSFFQSPRTGLLLLLALVAVVPTPASAQTTPTCTLLLQGSNPVDPLTITAVVNCLGSVTTITIFWGDGASTSSSGASITATHTYSLTTCVLDQSGAVNGICEVDVEADTIPTVSGYVDLTAPASPPPVFGGESSDVLISLFGTPANLQVTFECTTVTDSSGGVHQASDLGITCDSNPPTITFTDSFQTVSIGIHTSGTGIASLTPVMRHNNVLYALLLPLAAFFLPGVRVGTVRSCLRVFSKFVVTATVIFPILILSSCGGGFTPHQPVQSTPPGSYQVTVIDQPLPGQNTTGFVQTSLIVPLTVNQVQ